MGWNAVKEHYGIERTVFVGDGLGQHGKGHLFIAGLLPDGQEDLMVCSEVSPNGDFHNSAPGDKGIRRVLDRIAADPALFADIFASRDKFSEAVPVYTFDDAGNIVQKFAQSARWRESAPLSTPAVVHLTHDGWLIEPGRFFDTPGQAAARARTVADNERRAARAALQELKAQEASVRLSQSQAEAKLAKLNYHYPQYQIRHHLTGEVLFTADVPRRSRSVDHARIALEQAANLQVSLAGADLRGVNAAWASLVGLDLRGALANDADFTGADLRDVNLSTAALDGARLLQAKLGGTNFEGARLPRARLVGAGGAATNFSGADLEKAVLSNTMLPRARFVGAKLIRTLFNSAALPGADFTNADITDAEFLAADLYEADLRGHTRKPENFDQADLTSART